MIYLKDSDKMTKFWFVHFIWQANAEQYSFNKRNPHVDESQNEAIYYGAI